MSLVRLSPALFNHTCPESKDVMIDDGDGVAKGPYAARPSAVLLRQQAAGHFAPEFYMRTFCVMLVSTGVLFLESSEGESERAV